MSPFPAPHIFALRALLLLAADLTGRVTAVSDGDTMTLLVPEGASFKSAAP